MSAFDFGAAATQLEAWTPPLQDRLGKGNYVVKITELENTTSGGGYPMLKLKLECGEGVQWDNVVISPHEFAVGKLLALLDSAGLPRPVPGTDIDPMTGRLSDEYANKLFGREVGILVRDEEDNRPDHQGEFQPKVNGRYRKPSDLAGKTGAVAGSPSGNGAKSSKPADDDIPF